MASDLMACDSQKGDIFLNRSLPLCWTPLWTRTHLVGICEPITWPFQVVTVAQAVKLTVKVIAPLGRIMPFYTG